MTIISAGSSGGVQTGVITPDQAKNVVADTLKFVVKNDTLGLGVPNTGYLEYIAKTTDDGKPLISTLPLSKDNLFPGDNGAPRAVFLTDTTSALEYANLLDQLFKYTRGYGDRISPFSYVKDSISQKNFVGSLGMTRDKRTNLGPFVEGQDYIVNKNDDGSYEILFLPGAVTLIPCARQVDHALTQYLATVPPIPGPRGPKREKGDKEDPGKDLTPLVTSQVKEKTSQSSDFPNAFVLGGGYGIHKESTGLGTKFNGKGPSGLVEVYIPGKFMLALNAGNVAGGASRVSKTGENVQGEMNNTEVSLELMKYFGNPFGKGLYAGIGGGIGFDHKKTVWPTSSVERLEFNPDAAFEAGYNFSLGRGWLAGPNASVKAGKRYGNETVNFMGNTVERKWLDGEGGYVLAPGISVMKTRGDGKLPSFKADASVVFARDGTIYGPFKQTQFEGGATLYLGSLAAYLNASYTSQGEPGGPQNSIKAVLGGLKYTF